MLAEEKALLVPEFGRAEREAIEDAPREVVVCAREAMLIARLKAGHLDAFDEIVNEYQPLVYALSFRILNEAEDARDACQETFLKVYRHFGHFRGEASLKTWICRIAINQARSTERWWRRRYKSETSSLDETPANLLSTDQRIPCEPTIEQHGVRLLLRGPQRHRHCAQTRPRR